MYTHKKSRHHLPGNSPSPISSPLVRAFFPFFFLLPRLQGLNLPCVAGACPCASSSLPITIVPECLFWTLFDFSFAFWYSTSATDHLFTSPVLYLDSIRGLRRSAGTWSPSPSFIFMYMFMRTGTPTCLFFSFSLTEGQAPQIATPIHYPLLCTFWPVSHTRLNTREMNPRADHTTNTAYFHHKSRAALSSDSSYSLNDHSTPT